MNLILTISHKWSCGWGERLVFKVSKLVSRLSLTPFPLWKHHLWWRNSLMRFYGYKKWNVGSSLWEIMKEPEGVPQSAGGEVSSSLLKSCVLLRATALEQKKSELCASLMKQDQTRKLKSLVMEVKQSYIERFSSPSDVWFHQLYKEEGFPLGQLRLVFASQELVTIFYRWLKKAKVTPFTFSLFFSLVSWPSYLLQDTYF